MLKIKPSEVSTQACSLLNGKWGKAVTITIAYLAMSFAVGMLQVISPLLYVVAFIGVILPLAVGLHYMFLDLKRDKPINVSDIFNVFKNYLPILGIVVLTYIVVSIGMILLIVPGIIFSLGLSMSYYILRDRPELGAIGSIKASWTMMKGHKMEYFILLLSFIGWYLLGIITLLIGFIWILPYISTAQACFYDRIKDGKVAL